MNHPPTIVLEDGKQLLAAVVIGIDRYIVPFEGSWITTPEADVSFKINQGFSTYVRMDKAITEVVQLGSTQGYCSSI